MYIIHTAKNLFRYIALIITGGLILAPVAWANNTPREVIVGTWDNPPLVYRDNSGQITGLSIDILQQVASDNNWKLTFHHDSWANNYDALQNGSIDLLAVIAYSPQRAELFDYPKQTLINNWGVIYQGPEQNITSIQDLQGKRVALVPKIIHSKVFSELMGKFDFPFETVPAKDFEDVLKLMNDGKADAGVINRVVSIMTADKYRVKPTSIIFNPVQVRYATLKGKNSQVISALDKYLTTAKTNKDSHYYHSVNKWLKNEGEKPDYSWVMPLLAVIFLLFTLIAIYIVLVRREVKRRTAELTESENRFRQLADNINAAFWIATADWNEMIYISPGYEKIWGLPTDSLSCNATSWIDSVHPDDRAQVMADITAKSPPDEGNPAFHEYRILSPNGQERWISTRVYPVYDSTGKVYRIAGLCEDITARKQTEMDLAHSKAELETIFNAISDVVLYSDTDRRLIHVNPATETIFGYSSEELLGRNTEIFYADKADFEQQGNRQFSKTSDIKSASYEMRYRRKDGSTFIGETFGAKVFDNEGRMIGFIGVIRDVTQRKQVEAELRQHQEHLEELVTERTAELSNLNHELEAFSYSVSHDLRAPLRAINGFSTILCHEFKSKLDEEGIDYLERIQKASIKMGHLIDDLINLSRVSRVDLNKETVDLSSMAEEILTALHNAEPDRKVSWDIEKGLSVKADKTLIHVMLQNLLGNAWKYTAKTPEATIGLYRQPLEGEPDALCVEDNGIGFDTEYKHKIFQPFERLHSHSEFEGTGIGLATVYRVIKRHAGQIWAESTLNGGSRFYFRL
jgi:PAS domain S-box-containing protein